MLKIENHGPLITATNYWSLPPKRGELCFVSVNAGAFRLLLRPEAREHIPDMQAAREVLISRGPWPAARLPDAIEILFEDGSTDPFALHLQIESFDRLPTDSDQGKPWTLSVWDNRTANPRPRPRQVLERPCWYRRVSILPWLKPREAPHEG